MYSPRSGLSGTKIVKSAAKLNNEKVADVVKAASQISIKLMAHTRLTD